MVINLLDKNIFYRYHGPIAMEDANEQLAEHINIQAQEANVVQARVEFEGLIRRNAIWVQLNHNHLPHFPRLTLEYLKRLTIGNNNTILEFYF